MLGYGAAPPTAPDSVDRWIAPCSLPTRTVGHPACRRTLAGFPDGILEALAERSFARICSAFTPQSGSALDTTPPPPWCGTQNTASRALLVRRPQRSRTRPGATRARHLAELPAHPQLQRLGLLVDLASIYPEARPAQYPRPVVVPQTGQSTENARPPNPVNPAPCQILAQSQSYI